MSLIETITAVFSSPALSAAAWGFASSFALCVLLVLTKPWHGTLTMDFTDGIQKFHTAPTPRIGGIPVVLGVIVAWGKAPADVQQVLTPLLFAGMPAFIFGVAEDITKRVGVCSACWPPWPRACWPGGSLTIRSRAWTFGVWIGS